MTRNGFGYKMSARRRTRPTRTCSARRTKRRTSSFLDKGIKIVEPIMGVAFWRDDVDGEAGERSRALRRRQPVALNGIDFTTTSRCCSRRTDRRPATASA
jgi:argininosuccinate synthase